jgi:hypothetical protein
MKLFQQLLVAPAALGLLASGANAAELLLIFVLGADLLSTKNHSEIKKAYFSNLSLKSIIDQSC